MDQKMVNIQEYITLLTMIQIQKYVCIAIWNMFIDQAKYKNFLTKILIMLILQNTGDKYGKYKKSYISRCNQATTRRR